MCIYICVCGSKTRVVAGPPPVTNLCREPSVTNLVADLCVEYRSLQGACRGGVCRRTPPSVANLCRDMAAQACYKANVFDSLPHLYIYICIYINTYIYIYIIHITGDGFTKRHVEFQFHSALVPAGRMRRLSNCGGRLSHAAGHILTYFEHII